MGPARLLVLVLSLMAGSAVLAALWPPKAGRDALDWERLWRKTYVSLGWTLPGTPDGAALDKRLKDQGMRLGAPVLVRIFKAEFELEIWLMRDGRFERFATYPICRWSGDLGPKFRHGDHQAPEGFYAVGTASLNPNSRWHRSFNLGFPNAFDAANGRSGSFLMVHGGCSSVGCYAMTNAGIDEIWRIVTAALDGGQKAFQAQAFPFRMTDANFARHASHPHVAFWRELQRGNDLFEAAHLPPRVGVCGGRYVFEAGTAGPGGGEAPACPPSAKPAERTGGKVSG